MAPSVGSKLVLQHWSQVAEDEVHKGEPGEQSDVLQRQDRLGQNLTAAGGWKSEALFVHVIKEVIFLSPELLKPLLKADESIWNVLQTKSGV